MPSLPYDEDYNPTKQGVFQLPWVVYRRIKALNSSILKEADKSLLHLKTARDEPYKEPTPAMVEGQAFHQVTLEPERFDEEFVIEPTVTDIITDPEKAAKTKNLKATSEYKGWKLRQGDKMLISAKNLDKVQDMVRSMLSKETPRKFLSSGWTERTVLWRDKKTGIACKARLDFISTDRSVVDLKKCETVGRDAWGFGNAIRRYHYNWQAHWYLRGINAATGIEHGPFRWVSWEPDPPYEGRVIEADPDALKEAGISIDQILDQYAVALESGVYPGYPDDVKKMGFDYEYPEFDEEDESIPF